MIAVLAHGVRLLVGIGLLPFVIGYGWAFSEQLAAVRQVESGEVSFLLGITAYLACHAVIGSPSRAYVFGHEMTHALAAWVSGGRVKAIKVGAKSGSVQTNKITAITALAPYLVPIYAVVWALLFWAAGLFGDTSGWVSLLFFGLGFALAFHLVFTINVLKQKQPDLEVVGPVLGLAVILLVNLIVVTGVASLVSRDVRFLSYMRDGFQYTQSIYEAIFNQLFEI